MASDQGVQFLASRGRAAAGALGMLDMLGRQAPEPDRPPLSAPDQPGPAERATFGPDQTTPRKRLVISWGPREGVLMLGLEVAPDWDLERSWMVPQTAVWDLMEVLREVAKIKDLTGQFSEGRKDVESQERARPHSTNPATGPNDARREATGTAPDRRRGRKDRATRASVGVGRTADGPDRDGPDQAMGSGPAPPVP